MTRDERWSVIRAARAYYGRPLQLEDLLKIDAAAARVQSAPRIKAPADQPVAQPTSGGRTRVPAGRG
jgi:hypothetical protein